MKRDPRDLVRYTAGERINHWIVGISFILLGVSGLALFHPAFFPFTMLFGGPTWTRILHPFLGVLMAVFFVFMFFRFLKNNLMRRIDWQWIGRIGEMVDGSDETMPAQGKYNGGQKLLFWLLALCMLLLIPSGILLWQVYFDFSVEARRWAAVIHSAAAVVMICLIFVHVYAAIWVKGTIRSMWYGTVTRAWARQHHRNWYEEVTKS
ncbi:MAG: formate dehydrogenase subunit gamma [Thiohalocapsa sp.]|jgi:formate dehydrogenase subunit gamma|uniref:formate dehydrogenase subunit gamma n=1 Tax=Thiohalocapsa sp. TaxID=2497641 RepID=UPI0025D589A2|nr:formate dehydrogenase subunit gamma [Thiohalocapsa sp.]MCG6940499.1 formate dehydrogenase subunit gamma [Thiohalocapsa sp.]